MIYISLYISIGNDYSLCVEDGEDCPEPDNNSSNPSDHCKLYATKDTTVHIRTIVNTTSSKIHKVTKLTCKSSGIANGRAKPSAAPF